MEPMPEGARAPSRIAWPSAVETEGEGKWKGPRTGRNEFGWCGFG